MLDLTTIDPATVQAGPELNALITKWMGWERQTSWWVTQDNCYVRQLNDWSPSTNPAHAGEARRKAAISSVVHDSKKCRALVNGAKAIVHYKHCNNDPGRAEALATCRAIVAAEQAAEQEEKT